jgi:hypothetical protein
MGMKGERDREREREREREAESEEDLCWGEDDGEDLETVDLDRQTARRERQRN